MYVFNMSSQPSTAVRHAGFPLLLASGSVEPTARRVRGEGEGEESNCMSAWLFNPRASEEIIPHLKSSPFEKGRGKRREHARAKQLRSHWEKVRVRASP